ncbi:MAG TPA: hypothetical protein VMI72_03925 [Roseiarcus sp.]|nr:hypothetical protein [Roseiarcus sp.]
MKGFNLASLIYRARGKRLDFQEIGAIVRLTFPVKMAARARLVEWESCVPDGREQEFSIDGVRNERGSRTKC